MRACGPNRDTGLIALEEAQQAIRKFYRGDPALPAGAGADEGAVHLREPAIVLVRSLFPDAASRIRLLRADADRRVEFIDDAAGLSGPAARHVAMTNAGAASRVRASAEAVLRSPIASLDRTRRPPLLRQCTDPDRVLSMLSVLNGRVRDQHENGHHPCDDDLRCLGEILDRMVMDVMGPGWPRLVPMRRGRGAVILRPVPPQDQMPDAEDRAAARLSLWVLGNVMPDESPLSALDGEPGAVGIAALSRMAFLAAAENARHLHEQEVSALLRYYGGGPVPDASALRPLCGSSCDQVRDGLTRPPWSHDRFAAERMLGAALADLRERTTMGACGEGRLMA